MQFFRLWREDKELVERVSANYTEYCRLAEAACTDYSGGLLARIEAEVGGCFGVEARYRRLPVDRILPGSSAKLAAVKSLEKKVHDARVRAERYRVG
ncbi:MAG: hypothetical protein ABIG95_01580 [Candidatus Woesearchaeota archaeon]